MRAVRIVWLASLGAVLFLLPSCGPTGGLPAGFTDTLVATVPAPTAIAPLPDGRVLVGTIEGELRVITAGGTLLAEPAMDISGKVCANYERGLLGVAVDPSFATNGFLYVFYTYNKFNNACPRRTLLSETPVHRVSRFTMGSDGHVATSSELVLLDNMPSFGGNHNGGDLHIGPDGNLWVSLGDGGDDYAGDSGSGGSNDAGRDRHVLLSKILRITPTGGIPADNPFQGPGTARCNLTGITNPGLMCSETYAWGLRNPFRFAFDPNATGSRFFINDVGQNVWEEIDLGRAGVDYGWNVREGFCPNGKTTPCRSVPNATVDGMTDPIYSYVHGADGCTSVTGAAFVPRGLWPSPYDGQYLFGDYSCGRIFLLADNGNGSYTRSDFATELGGGGPVEMTFAPAQGTMALYYTTYDGGGQVRRITYTGAANRAPTASLSADPVAGDVPLSVDFDASGSQDLDGDPLSYRWDYGDGSALTTTATAMTTHVYGSAGTFIATLTVTDDQGATSAPVTVRIDAGNGAPTPNISSPSPDFRFSVGEQITLHGSATDPEDGALPGSSLEWTVIRHHATHTHPLLPPTEGDTVTFPGPDPEDLAAAADSHLEIILRATDSKGASSEVRQDLLPLAVDLTFQTDPPGRTIEVNGQGFSAPATVTSWAGWGITVDAPTQTDASGATLYFDSWSHDRAGRHLLLTPAAPATYTATFRSEPGPLADAGPDRTVPPDVDFELDGSGSTDPQGGTLTYQWVQVVGPNTGISESDRERATVGGQSGPKTLIYKLTVTDGDGHSSSDEVTITVAPK